MQDIDFDELDRAVSSVLGTTTPITPTSAVPPSAPAITPVPYISPSVDATPLPEPVSTPVNPASNVHVVTTTTQTTPRSIINAPPVASPSVSEPTVLRRSTGRFMDVVHPSSAMRTAPAAQPAVQAAPVFMPPQPVQEQPIAPAADIKAEDLMMAFEETSEPDTMPLETPFLTDAKVEKRPLGAFSTAEPEEQLVIEQIPEPASYKPPVFEPSLEISEEALIGSSETADTDPKALQPVEITVEPKKEAQPEAAQATVSTAPTTASIIQQYIEQPSTDEQPSGAIFDTESYHQPLTHPGKGKAGLLTVLWILGLIILGAGLGILAYHFISLQSL